MATQSEIAANIVTQLRLLDPSISATIGTPERKIIDAVAQSIAGYQIDINMLNGALDIETKYGTDLENMLAIFGFGRQKGSKASGYVTFKTDAAKSASIVINAGTQLLAPAASNGSDVIFVTSRSVTLEAGKTSVVAPVECIASGEFGNIAANTITAWSQTAISGIVSLTNESPIVGGSDSESDESLKARFKTTGPFRNLAGTQDQYLATALSTFTTKATVIGPVSKYIEYIQVPSNSDQEGGNGVSSEYTTALSTNTNAKYIYDNLQFFVSNNQSGIITPYVQDIDYKINVLPENKNKGDSYRNFVAGTGADPTSSAVPTKYQPNVTFTNVYTGTDTTINLVQPKEVLLFEYSYISSASRNDYERGVLNCVDVFVNGSNPQLANAIIPRPGSSVSIRTFNNTDLNSAFYYTNYRRMGEPNHYPIVGNIFTPLMNQPVIDLPDEINISESTFIQGIHYWGIEDATSLRGTVRARNGIEWSVTIRSKAASDSDDGPYTGPFITDIAAIQSTLTLDASASSGYLFVADFDKFGQSGRLQINNEKIEYAKSSTTTWSSSITYGYSTISTGGGINASATTFTAASGANFPSSGFIIVDNEIMSYTLAGATFTIVRGQFGTTAASHAQSAAVRQFIRYNGVGYSSSAAVGSGENSPDLNSTKWEKIGSILTATNRAVDGTIAAKHTIGASVKTAFSSTDSVLSINNYIYDANIPTLQAALEGSKQITTDVLAHKAKTRYFKPDITVMYTAGSNPTAVNGYIKTSLDNYFNSIYFGNAIQLSDILQVIHNTTGVDNVRWSKDVLGSASKDSVNDPRNRMVETDSTGESLDIALDLITIGDGNTATKYQMYFANDYTGGEFKIQHGTNAAQPVVYAMSGSTPDYVTTRNNLQSAINAFGTIVSITGGGKFNDPYIITYINKSDVNRLKISDTNLLIGGTNAFNSDFFLKDDELASLPIGKISSDGVLDITSVMTIRVKAQNTWNQING